MSRDDRATPDRRQFLKQTLVLTGAVAAGSVPAVAAAASRRTRPSQSGRDVVVIGAGAFGGWTAYYLRQMGAGVTLIDAYGPGNSRATSGDETRGVRTSYGTHPQAELWMGWANQAIDRWQRFDDEWGKAMKLRLFFTTGDLIMREKPEPVIDKNKELWTKLGIPFEVLKVDDVAARYPVIDLKKITQVLYEPRAGVVRARRACEVVAETLRQDGGEVALGYASPGAREGRRLLSIETVAPAQTYRADTFVFALGPWFPKLFPDLMGPRIRTPLGHVHYFGTPPRDDRFTFPNLPSYNFPGVTGWPALPPDNRGFRVRLRGDRLMDPDASPRAFERKKDKDARKLLRQRFPMLKDAPLLETRACHYEFSLSRNFIIDRHPDLDNVWLAGGGSAEGFKFGPVVGEYIAKRVMGDDGDRKLADIFNLKKSEPAPPKKNAD